MNDNQAAAAILAPLRDHPLVGAHISMHRVNFSKLYQPDPFQMLSSGEQALIRIAKAVFQWSAIRMEDLMTLDSELVRHVLDVLAERLHAAPSAVSR